MLDGIVKSLQKLGFTFKNEAIDDILSENPSVMAVESRFLAVLSRLNLKRLKQEGKPYLDSFRKLITENYQMHRISDIEIYTNAYFKAILDQIDVKITKKMMEPYRKPIFEYYLKEKDAMIYQLIEVFMDEVCRNGGSLRSVDMLYVYSVFTKAHSSCSVKCDQVYAENRQIDVVCQDFAKFIFDQKNMNK